MVAHTRTLFAMHHINLPAGNVTPEQVRRAINEWLLKTFELEWRVVTSGLPKNLAPHEATDPFEPDEDNPDDLLRSLPPYLRLNLFGACVQHKVAATLHSCIPSVLHAASTSTESRSSGRRGKTRVDWDFSLPPG